MPFLRTAVHKGTDAATKETIVHGIHDALVAAIGMPQDELFNLVQEYDPADFFYDRRFNRIARSDRLVVVEITMRRGRSDAMKRLMYAGITKNLEDRAGVSPRDVFIFTYENDYSDWSVGNGVFAMACSSSLAPIDDARAASIIEPRCDDRSVCRKRMLGSRSRQACDR